MLVLNKYKLQLIVFYRVKVRVLKTKCFQRFVFLLFRTFKYLVMIDGFAIY